MHRQQLLSLRPLLAVIAPVALAALGALVALTACAPATSADTSSSQPNTVMRTGSAGAHVSLGAGGGASVHGVGAPVADAWTALQRVYESLEIPLTTVDARSHRLGNQQFRVSRRLGGEPLAYYVDCGLGAGGVAYANTARLTLSIVTTLRAAGDSAEVRSEVSGTGRSADATGGDLLRCTTTGHLENRIASMLRERVRNR